MIMFTFSFIPNCGNLTTSLSDYVILFDDHERDGMNNVKKTPSLRRKRIRPKLCRDSQPFESVVRRSQLKQVKLNARGYVLAVKELPLSYYLQT